VSEGIPNISKWQVRNWVGGEGGGDFRMISLAIPKIVEKI